MSKSARLAQLATSQQFSQDSILIKSTGIGQTSPPAIYSPFPVQKEVLLSVAGKKVRLDNGQWAVFAMEILSHEDHSPIPKIYIEKTP